jgi:protein-S-isoprenylcysteine O-methyltransferase Ste14
VIEPWVVTLFPVLFLIVLFGGGALFRRRNIDMDGEAPIDKTLFLISKYLIVVLWLSVILHAWGIRLSFVQVPAALVWVSVCIWVFGFALLFIGRLGLGDSFRIGSPKEKTGLKTDGLFRLSRNPMYVGVYATLLAAVLYTMNPILLLGAAFVVAVHHRIVLAEEQHLRRLFGREYVDYCGRVGRYL